MLQKLCSYYSNKKEIHDVISKNGLLPQKKKNKKTQKERAKLSGFHAYGILQHMFCDKSALLPVESLSHVFAKSTIHVV